MLLVRNIENRFAVPNNLRIFAFEHRHDVRVRTAVGHRWKKKSIRYYFAFSQKRRKLIGNKNATR
jgi:hypothetical protein